MTSKYLIAGVALTAILSACTSPQAQQRARMASMAERVLERAGSIGDPGRVAAADFAFARMARDEGQWTAFRHYAAPGAVMDAPGRVASVTSQLAGLADPPEPILWAPNTVWSSCDGRLAVSLGRSRRPSGIVGSYVTIWALQPDNSYRYTYDTGTPDDPQPLPAAPEDIPEGAIVVPGLTSIEGRIADCPRADQPAPPPPALAFPVDVSVTTELSSDGTLRWTRTLAADGSRSVHVEWLREGSWQSALDFDIPPRSQG